MRKYLWKAKWEFLASNILAVLDVICLSCYPWLLSYVIDNFRDLTGRDMAGIFTVFLTSIAALLGVEYLNKLTKAKYQRRICGALRRDVFEGIANMDWTRFHARKCEDYTSFLVSDIGQLYALYFENLIYLINRVLMLTVYGVILAMLNWQMCLTAMGSLVLIPVVPRLVGRRFQGLNEALSAGKADYLSRCGEVLGARELLDEGSLVRLRGLHHRQLDVMQERQYALSKYASFVQIFSGSALYIQLSFCFIVGVLLAWRGKLSVGALATCLLYVEYVAQYSANLVNEFLEVRSAKTYRDRCLEFLTIPREKRQAGKPCENLTLDRVRYRLGDRDLLREVSYEFVQGKKYLITGANGAGKSTLLKLLAGLIQPTGGTVLIPKGVGCVPQKRHVFEGTLADNVSLFEDRPDREKIRSLCALVNLRYPPDHPIAAGGQNLSGGEAAKLCLLRELYRDREILLIDEPMNDVDTASAADILHLLLGLHKTVVMVAHGLDGSGFDEVLTISDGRISLS